MRAERQSQQKVPRGDAIAGTIRSRIITGRLKPGNRLREDRLAEEFGVSRVPIREAIRRLDAEGYVTVTLNAGARVAVPSARDAHDLLQVRTALEVLAARLAAERRGGDRLDQLARLLRQGENLLAGNKFSRVAAAAEQFHEVMIEASGNEQLIRMLADVRAKLAWIWTVNIEHRAPSSWEAHNEIYAAIRDGDIAAVTAITTAHLARDETIRDEAIDDDDSATPLE